MVNSVAPGSEDSYEFVIPPELATKEVSRSIQFNLSELHQFCAAALEDDLSLGKWVIAACKEKLDRNLQRKNQSDATASKKSTIGSSLKV